MVIVGRPGERADQRSRYAVKQIDGAGIGATRVVVGRSDDDIACTQCNNGITKSIISTRTGIDKLGKCCSEQRAIFQAFNLVK